MEGVQGKPFLFLKERFPLVFLKERFPLAFYPDPGSCGKGQIRPRPDAGAEHARVLGDVTIGEKGDDGAAAAGHLRAQRAIMFEHLRADGDFRALRQSSAGWDTNENSYFPFIENFLSTLYMCYKELDKRFAVVHGKRITKKARVEATVLNSLTPLSKADICKILPDVSPTTVEAVLGAMIRTGSVKRIGAGRATRYIKA